MKAPKAILIRGHVQNHPMKSRLVAHWCNRFTPQPVLFSWAPCYPLRFYARLAPPSGDCQYRLAVLLVLPRSFVLTGIHWLASLERAATKAQASWVPPLESDVLRACFGLSGPIANSTYCSKRSAVSITAGQSLGTSFYSPHSALHTRKSHERAFRLSHWPRVST